MKRQVFLSFLCIILSLAFIGCSDKEELKGVSQAASINHQLTSKEHQSYTQEITLSAIGDLLIHSPLYDDARLEGGYDFLPMLMQVEAYLADATITVANQETMIGGEEIGLSTYPSFNSPYEVGDALKEVGVDVVTLANNHTLDRGEMAIQNAIEHWETIDMVYTGAYKDELDREEIRIYDTDEGISVAFLSYTYGTNGIPVPEGKDYLVNLIDKDRMEKDIEIAKEKADVIAMSLHFGNEYERLPNESQKDLVQFAADLGVDLVIGHHPHVLQPMEYITGKDGNQTFVVYSLGNFLSNQQELYQRIGGMVKVKITKTVKGDEHSIEVRNPEFLPTYVKFHSDWSNYEVKPMFQLSDDELPGAAGHYEEIKAHMSQWMPELEFIEN